MKRSGSTSLALAALALATSASAAQDLGANSTNDLHSFSMVLKLHDQDGLARFIEASVNPRSGQYHRFLSVGEFTARYSPSQAEVDQVVAHLNAGGIQVDSVSANRMLLRATGTVAAINRFFNTELHDYLQGDQRYHAPQTPVVVPAALSGSVAAVTGLSSQRAYRSKLHRDPEANGLTKVDGALVASGSTSSGKPGQLTVGDVADLYQVGPLYKRGVKGQGRTVGIVTLANFDQADAYAYWSAIGLKVKAGRITEIPVDGGTDSNGADETTLDVQQAGGLAPAANILVYEGPNAGNGFIDSFIQAVVDNRADTLSTSWGEAELYNDPASTAAFDQVLMEAAAQGISVFASSGDAGAYDINRFDPLFGFNAPVPCSATLSVDAPASSPWITAAGGLTLAGTQHRRKGDVVVPEVRPWAWDYLIDYLTTNYPGQELYYTAGYFPVGAGGGVSVAEPLPRYQRHTRGIRKSAPSQVLFCVDNQGNGFDLTGPLPGNFAGRNVPDLSLNADPNTGYVLVFGGVAYAGNGGTSFVAPQLNGITALLSQSFGDRLGLLNPVLYRLARHERAYDARGPFNDITAEDNLAYQAGPGYDPASGIGSLNAANLARALGDDDGDDGDDDR